MIYGQTSYLTIKLHRPDCENIRDEINLILSSWQPKFLVQEDKIGPWLNRDKFVLLNDTTSIRKSQFVNCQLVKSIVRVLIRQVKS